MQTYVLVHTLCTYTGMFTCGYQLSYQNITDLPSLNYRK